MTICSTKSKSQRVKNMETILLDRRQIVVLHVSNLVIFDEVFRVKRDRKWHQISLVSSKLRLDNVCRIEYPGKSIVEYFLSPKLIFTDEKIFNSPNKRYKDQVHQQYSLQLFQSTDPFDVSTLDTWKFNWKLWTVWRWEWIKVICNGHTFPSLVNLWRRMWLPAKISLRLLTMWPHIPTQHLENFVPKSIKPKNLFEFQQNAVKLTIDH